MTCVRQRRRVVGCFKPKAPVGTINETQQALPEHNGPQKPGRATAPKGTDSSYASAPGDLDFAHPRSRQSTLGVVLGRRSDPQQTRRHA